jgi:hypothetical protein
MLPTHGRSGLLKSAQQRGSFTSLSIVQDLACLIANSHLEEKSMRALCRNLAGKYLAEVVIAEGEDIMILVRISHKFV